MQAVLIHRERITDSGNTTLDKTTINGEYMCCLLSLQNWNVPLALTFLLTGFVQSLEFFQTWKKSGKWRKSLEKWLMMDLSFFFKVTTSALEVNLFRLFKYYSFKLTRMFVVCSVQWKKLWSCILKISIDYLPWAWKKKLSLWKKVWKKTWILDPKICTNPVLTSVPLTFESLSSS